MVRFSKYGLIIIYNYVYPLQQLNFYRKIIAVPRKEQCQWGLGITACIEIVRCNHASVMVHAWLCGVGSLSSSTESPAVYHTYLNIADTPLLCIIM